MACGACASACPTNAISFMKPTDEELDNAVDEFRSGARGRCSGRVRSRSSHRAADVEATATVPCVSRLDTQALVGACARNDASLVVVDGGCKTCKYRFASRQFDISQKRRTSFVGMGCSFSHRTNPASSSSGCRQRRIAGRRRRLPPWVLHGNEGFRQRYRSRSRQYDRRKRAWHSPECPDSLRDILKVDNDGNMPRIAPARHDALMEYLFEMGEPREGSSVKTRLWGKVDIDETLCTRCGICSTFCPTGALSKVFGEADGKKRPSIEGIEFRLADCVQCRLCEDSCMQKALRVSDEIPCDLILDLEPRLFKGEGSKGRIRHAGLVRKLIRSNDASFLAGLAAGQEASFD